MLSNATSTASISSDLSLGGGFEGLGFSFPGPRAEAPALSLGVSTSTGPLISAPATRQTAEFQALIAPPTLPSNPSLAPPKTGREANAMGVESETMGSSRMKLSSMNLETMGPKFSGPSADHSAIAALVDKGFGLLI